MGKRKRRRDRIETALAQVGGVLEDVDEVILRMRQAERRSPAVKDVLDPAIVRLDGLRDELKLLKEELMQIWMDGQEGKWG
jgi:hypothetical protein